MPLSQKLRTYEGTVDGVYISHGVIVGSDASAERVVGRAATREATLAPTQFHIEVILKRATEVIGTREKAMRWLGTPVRALDYATPISLISSDTGAEWVLATLTNLEHGIL
jgi:putative toxin-antitoxin system antitoxin component (TIGR02293 family)